MTLLEAKELLNKMQRYELRDHAFGDREVTWVDEDSEVAFGYFSGSSSEVSISEYNTTFTGDEAAELVSCGHLSQVERNDETGPENYQDGKTMPGLTLQGVLEEITTPPVGFGSKADDWNDRSEDF